MGDRIRTFSSGATRDAEEGKLDYEAFLSPVALVRYAEYMNKHRRQPNGQMRPGDNWQKGIPKDAYMKSMWRHMMDAWMFHRGHRGRETMQDALCGVIFNAFGMLHEITK